MNFPTVTGSNLLRDKLNLPADFEGDLNIVLMAFYRPQQAAVDTWIPFAKELEQEDNRIRYYELPVIEKLGAIQRMMINEGMRSGIPDEMARARTITLYLDKAAFRESLELPHEEDIYVMLVDRQGNVLWRAEGAFAPEKGESLTMALKKAA
jgi:hypothetical protein